MGVFSKWSGRLAFILGLLAILLIASLGPGFKAGWWDFGFAFGHFKIVVYLGLAAAILAILHFISSLVAKQKIAGMALIGLLLGVSAAAVPIQMKRTAASLPYIHDITTDTANPPKFVEIAKLRVNAPNPISYNSKEAELQTKAYPDIKTKVIDSNAADVFMQAKQAVVDLGWELVAADEASGIIEATETTTWFGFKDDVVIRITTNNGKTHLDVRSKSRMGRSDLGANAKRIRKLLSKL